MIKDEDPSLWMETYQAEDLSAKMARKFKQIPPPLNLSAMGDSDASNSPLKDFAMLATSPRSPLVQKNLPFRKRAHSYSSTQTSSECDSPESPRVPASPLAMVPSPSPFSKSPLSSPSHLLGKRYLQEPIKSLLPSPNTSASFFNNECDPIKSPCLNFYRPAPDLLPIPMLEKTSLKSPLQTPTRSVFLQNHVDSTLFFTDMDKLPIKSPLNTPTPRTQAQPVVNDDNVFVMPEPISVKVEPVEPEKENLASDNSFIIKSEPNSESLYMMEPPLDLAFDANVKNERASPVEDPSRSHEISMNYYLDAKILESFAANKRRKSDLFISHSLGLYCSELASNYAHTDETDPSVANPYQSINKAPMYKPITYRKTNGVKRPTAEKPADEPPKKTKKEIDDERPRRPMNAFMLFAKHQRPLLIQQHPGKDNRAISVVLGSAWRELEATERAEYVRRAAAMAVEHKRLHPDCWKRRRVRVTSTAAASASPSPAATLQTTSS